MKYPREILKVEAIDSMQSHLKVHDLNPNAVRSAKFLASATGLKNIGFDVMTVMPGQEASEFHRHLYEEECYYILAGTGQIRISDETYPVGPGDFLGFPANGVAHTLDTLQHIYHQYRRTGA